MTRYGTSNIISNNIAVDDSGPSQRQQQDGVNGRERL